MTTAELITIISVRETNEKYSSDYFKVATEPQLK
jgi:hypothetical protein